MRGASKKLWSFPTGSGHRGSTISYSVNGRQYIATPSGWGSAVSGLMGQLWPEAEQFLFGIDLEISRTGERIFAGDLFRRSEGEGMRARFSSDDHDRLLLCWGEAERR